MVMTETSDQAPAYRWVVMGVWLTASVSGFMIMSTLGILLPAISEDLDLSPTQQGLLGSAAFWGNLALAIPLSWWTSRYGPKILTTVTLLLGTVFLFMQGWAPVFAVLLFGRLAFGVTVIARQPARAFLMQQWFPQREVLLVNSISNAMFGLVVGGGLAAAPFILNALGDDWRTTLNLFGGLFAVLTILWAALGRERVTTDFRRLAASQDTSILKGTLRHRDLWIGGVRVRGGHHCLVGIFKLLPHHDADRPSGFVALVRQRFGSGYLHGRHFRSGIRLGRHGHQPGQCHSVGPGRDDGGFICRDDVNRQHPDAARTHIHQWDSMGVLANPILGPVPLAGYQA